MYDLAPPIADLQSTALAHGADLVIARCRLTRAELVDAVAPLHEISPAQIATVVAMPPEEWGITVEERVEVCKYLRLRQLQLLALYGPMKPVSHPRARAAE